MLNVKRKKKFRELVWVFATLLCWCFHGWFSGLSGLEVKNIGISFGWNGWLVITLSLSLLLILTWFGWKKEYLGIEVVLVGGWVNMIDRIVFGYVRDYWRFGTVYNNIADWIISVGIIVFIWEIWKKK